MKAYVVQGLGFGDEGKGSLVDALVRRHRAELVVRFNGGAQAAHHVVTPDGKVHCFAQFGSGTLAGAHTFLSRYMLVNPIFAIAEAKHLEALGVSKPFSRLSVDENAVITTPYHVAMNRLRELERGKHRHGSCGMGIGEARAHELSDPAMSVRVADLAAPHVLERKLSRLRDAYLSTRHGEFLERTQGARDWAVLEDKTVLEETLDRYAAFRKQVRVVGCTTDLMRSLEVETVVFEGAQGVLLDEVHGFPPYTTWTDCTFGNADRLLSELDHGKVYRIGVSRVFQTRHGAGPMPSEMEVFQPAVGRDHNGKNDWQGSFRVGALDLVLLRYALDRMGPCDLFFTCLDTLAHVRCAAEMIPVCASYHRVPDELFSSPGRIDTLKASSRALTDVLSVVQPELIWLETGGHILAHLLADLVGRRLNGFSCGPTWKEKNFIRIDGLNDG